MNEIEEGISKVLRLNDEQRYLLSGQLLSETDFGISPKNPDQLIRSGEEWLTTQINELRTKICRNDSIKTNINFIGEFELAFSIADLILGQYGKLPAILISVQIVKKGINTVCHDIWESNDMA